MWWGETLEEKGRLLVAPVTRRIWVPSELALSLAEGLPVESVASFDDCGRLLTELLDIATLMAMWATEQMPLAAVKNRLSEVVERLEREHGRVVITKHGRPAAVVLSVEDLDSLEETLDVLSSKALMDDVRAGVTDDAVPLSRAQALDLIADR